MQMTLDQTKFVALTMELELKTREYKSLCAELENLKSQNIDFNAKAYEKLGERFIKNQNEIAEIQKQLQQLDADKK